MTTGKKIVLGVAAVAVILGGAVMVSAHDLPANAPQWAQDAHAALQSGDYNAWKTAQQQRFDEMTTEEHFNDLKAMEDLVSQGKYDEARQYAQDHNLRPRSGFRHGFRAGRASANDQSAVLQE